jgi:hypothetical protein
VSISDNPKEKPILDPETFQCLLTAAFILQSENDLRKEALRLGKPSAPAIQGIIQERTLSLRRPPAQRNTLKPVIAFGKQRSWRTVEAFAVATVFCTMIGLSLGRVTPLAQSSRTPLAEERSTRSNRRPAAEILGSSQTHAATLDSRPTVDDFVAEDVLIRYPERPKDLHKYRPLKNLRRIGPQNAGSQAGVQYTFGKDTAMLAADTVIRYGLRIAPGANQDKP